MKKIRGKMMLTSMQLTSVIFLSEFSFAFVSIITHSLPLYAFCSVGGFILSIWYYRNK